MKNVNVNILKLSSSWVIEVWEDGFQVRGRVFKTKKAAIEWLKTEGYNSYTLFDYTSGRSPKTFSLS